MESSYTKTTNEYVKNNIKANSYISYNPIYTNKMSDTIERLTGRVKWFNNRSGFGFITVAGGDRNGQDIFVHYTSLNVSSKQYMYLVQGEYVEFELGRMAEGEKHEFQALKVSGISGGVLMCETRMQNPRPRRYMRRSESQTRRPDSRENTDQEDNRDRRGDRRREDSRPRYDDRPRRSGGGGGDRERDDRPRRNGVDSRPRRDGDSDDFNYVTRRRRVGGASRPERRQDA